MMRQLFLWLSGRRAIFRFVTRNGMARRMATRFVAGESLDAAIAAARELNANGIAVSLDLLGESVTNAADTRQARAEVLEIIDALASAQLRGNVSIKLTQLGLDISRDLCAENMRAILTRARDHNVFVRMDMEGSAHTQRTLELFYDVLYPEFDGTVGIVLQSYLRRSARDVADAIAAGARVRLCKGAYAEPAEVAFQERAEVDGSYRDLMRQLLTHGNYPGIATHDEAIIDDALAYVRQRRIAPDRFEFQMLYGVRRDLQESLIADGYNVRVYIPFGSAWYPYLMRRLAERPANVAFLTFSLLKETFRRS